MSLINDVLKDLDQKPDSQDMSVLGLIQSSSAPAKPKRSWGFLIVGLVVIVLLLLGAWGYLTQWRFDRTPMALVGVSSDSSTAQSTLESPSATGAERTEGSVTPPAVRSEPSAKPQPKMVNRASETTESADPLIKDNAIVHSVRASEPVNQARSESLRSSVINSQETRPTEPESALQADQEIVSGNNASQNKAFQSGVSDSTATSVRPAVSKPAPRPMNTDHSERSGQKPDQKQLVQRRDIDDKGSDLSTMDKERTLESTRVSKSKTREVQLYEAAVQAFKRGDYDHSERLIDQLLSEKNQPGYQALKARILLKRSPQSLVTYIDQSNLNIAASDELLGLAANAFQRSGDHIRAVKAYDLMVQRQPTEGRWWLAMAFSLEAENVLDKALKAYSLALQSGNLPANAREFAATKANQITKQLDAQAKQAEAQN